MALLVQVIVKVSIVLFAAWATTRVMSRASAAARHFVWIAAVVTVLVLPVVQWLSPTWDLPVLPGVVAGSDRGQVGVRPGSGWGQTPEQVVSTSLVESTQGLDTTRDGGQTPEPVVSTPQAVVSTTPPAATSGWTAPNWPTLVALGWLTITLLAVGRLLAGLAWVSWITRGADDVTDEGWLQLLDETAAALGVTRPVSLRSSGRTTIPVACGILHPTVLLPVEADAWTIERRRVVLLHEMAHVARRDCLTQAVVQFARALYWFNPLAHVAAAQVRAEQERACDDLVLAAGTDGPDYARHLFEIARAFHAERFPAWATLAMARPSQLEGRVVAILDDRCNRRPPDMRMRAVMAAATAVLVLPVGALQLTAAAPDAPATQQPASDALIDPNPVLPQRDNPSALASDAARASGDGVDVLVNAAAQMVDLLPNLDFDFDLKSGDWDFNLDFDPDPKPDPNPNPSPKSDPDPDFFVTPDWKITGEARVKLGAQANAQAQTQGQGQSNDSTVTDETRRRVADALITALNDENENVREQALNALASMRDARAIPGLVRATRDASPDVRQRALDALAQFSTQEAVDAIVAAVGDANPEVREHAVNHMSAMFGRGLMRDPKYVDTFVALLRDASPDVRQQAIVGLARLRNTNAVPALIPLLKDGNAEIRERAAVTLGTLADPRAIDALTAALRDPEPEVREEVARALGQIARGQRRGNGPIAPLPPLPPARPGVAAPPAPPARPGQPSAFRFPDIDVDAISEAALRAQEEALREVSRELNSPEFRRQLEEAQREIEDAQRDVERAERDIQRNR